ncbi:MAG: haloacid dehalogenase type II [Thiolinea sp.]
MTTVTLAFDVYGTLIDTHGVVTALQGMVGDKAAAFSQSWRDKQLEYTFRRGLMQRYENFPRVTRQALDYCCAVYGAKLSDAQKDELMAVYRVLPAFADVPAALSELSQAGFGMYAFSNGIAKDVNGLLLHAGIRDYFDGVVSVDDVRSFKPDPAVYAHFLAQSGAVAEQSWLISGNPFDVIGAVSAGMKAAWVQRSESAVFDPWGIEPTVVVRSLGELLQTLADLHGTAQNPDKQPERASKMSALLR